MNYRSKSSRGTSWIIDAYNCYHRLGESLTKENGIGEGSIVQSNHRWYLLPWHPTKSDYRTILNYSFLYTYMGCISSLVYTTRPELFIENTLRESRLSSEPEFELCKPLRVPCLRARARTCFSSDVRPPHVHAHRREHRGNLTKAKLH